MSSIEVSVLDSKDKLILRKFVDSNGVRPSIQTIPNREFEPNKPLMIFNPFYSFAANVELKKLNYKFKFETKDGKKQFFTETTVLPVFYQTKTNLILPIKGRAIIYDGHDFYAHHRRFDYMFEPIRALGFKSNFMRYSYDFCPVNESGEMFQGDETKNESWLGFGTPVYAAGNGKVIAVVDNNADNRSFDESLLAAKPMVLFGNYIVIDHLNGEYSVFAHLKQGSAQVKAGEMVKQGQQIAQIGASGSANIPHLHYELQNGTDTNAEGLPSYFRNFQRVLGAKIENVKFGQIDSGEIVQR